MRTGEPRDLKWSYIDRKANMIRLPAEATKEKRPKDIPINKHVKRVLNGMPRAIKHDFVFMYRGKPIVHKQGFKFILRNTWKKPEYLTAQRHLTGLSFMISGVRLRPIC